MNDELNLHLCKNRMNLNDSLPPNVRFVLNYVDNPVTAFVVIQNSFKDIRKQGKQTLINLLKDKGFSFIERDIDQ